MSGDISSFIRRELERLPSDRMVKINSDGSKAKIRCFNLDHKGGQESKPSFDVNITRNGKYWPGSGICRSCGFRVKNWNELAEHIFARKRDEQGGTEEFYSDSIFNDKIESELFEADEDAKLDILPWDAQQEWRTVSGKLLQRIRAGLMYDTNLKRMFVYLPCRVEGKVVGYVRANIVKQGKANYFNSDGVWTFKRGLFPYDFVKAMIRKRKYRTLVLVEGPRDALKCIQYGIPAIACLGASNWSEMKSELILALMELGITRVLTAFDPDEAGTSLTKAVNTALKDEIEVKKFTFDEGVDPGNMKREVALRLKNRCKRYDIAA